jgi:thiosulfate dehydrogenase
MRKANPKTLRTGNLSPLSLLLASGLLLALPTCGGKQSPSETPSTDTSPSAMDQKPEAQAAASGGTVDVLLCDGKTKTTVPEGTPGTTIAGQLMAEWIRKNPDANWEAAERERHTLVQAADNKELVGQVNGQTYGLITEEDVLLWKTETERAALAGSEVFHSGEKLGSTIGVSCDMCHPHAANTHPETYPKFQAQLGRVALLRDMINWCIEHPVLGAALAESDPRMRALESYILAQRKGKALEYGKH